MPTDAERSFAAAMAAAALLFGGCNVFDPTGAWVPVDPGQVVVHISDDHGQALSDVQACVEMPNDVGGVFKTCMQTDRRGRATFLYVSAGLRRVDVRPPSGFAAGADGLVRDVAVVKHEAAHVEFTLARVG